MCLCHPVAFKFELINVDGEGFGAPIASSQYFAKAPTALQQIFPWADFYGGSQRAYLAKDEYVTGAYGIEGRFPFLDVALVQEHKRQL